MSERKFLTNSSSLRFVASCPDSSLRFVVSSPDSSRLNLVLLCSQERMTKTLGISPLMSTCCPGGIGSPCHKAYQNRVATLLIANVFLPVVAFPRRHSGAAGIPVLAFALARSHPRSRSSRPKRTVSLSRTGETPLFPSFTDRLIRKHHCRITPNRRLTRPRKME